jgi:Zn-finger nucleic acid-binding protein
MKCPVCETRMREVEKDDDFIDVCPDCKGVWLDRGELEKLLSGAREIRPDFDAWYYGKENQNRHKYSKSDHHKKKNFFAKIEDIFGD